MIKSKCNRFLTSALQAQGAMCSSADALAWLQARCSEVHVRIDPLRLSEMTDWYMDEEQGRIRHHTGKFFSIDGLEVTTNIGAVRQWRQPIINQPEIGYLGCIVKEIDGVLHFLVQAKIEPGNVNVVQLSPTLQATKSNYTRAHKGKAPKYLEFFNTTGKSVVLLDQLQSEQGARFLNKRNRNIIVEVTEEIPFDKDFRWLTLGQIKTLTTFDNVVNMDLRTVIAGIPFDGCDAGSLEFWEKMVELNDSFKMGMLISAIDHRRSYLQLDEIISWFTGLKANCEVEVSRQHLRTLGEWNVTDEGIRHRDGLYFDVRWVNVEIENREVSSWQQPLVAPSEEGLIAFVIKKINGVYHFLVQAKMECGNFDILEFAPTVQCITGSYKHSLDKLPFLKYVLEVPASQIRFDALQSEEGGRFFHDQNRNMIVEAGSEFPIEVPSNFQWMTLHQLLNFIRFNNYLNIQTRGLLSGVQFS
jgi:oxidase EvaA